MIPVKFAPRELRYLIWSICILMVLFLGALFYRTASGDINKWYIPGGYGEKIEFLKKHEALTVINNDGQREIIYDRTKIPKKEDGEDNRDLLKFASPVYSGSNLGSYLYPDILAFNSGDGLSALAIDGVGEISYFPWMHRYNLPFYASRSWEGVITVNDYAMSAALENKDYTFRVNRPLVSELPLRRKNYQYINLADVTDKTLESQGLLLGSTGDLSSKIQVEYVGDDVSAGVIAEKAAFKINGEDVNIGTWVRLEDGDALYFGFTKPATYLRFRDSSSGRVLVRSRISGGRKEPLRYAEKTERFFPYAISLGKQLDLAFAMEEARPGQGKSALDLELTLDRSLQEEVLGKFEDHISSLDRNISYGWALPAAVTLMDALSGEVLTMVSMPSAETVHEMRAENPASIESLAASRGLEDNHLAMLTRDQNLVTHPLGSTVKPLMALAIWDNNESLINLKIHKNAHGTTIDSIAGLSILNDKEEGITPLPMDVGELYPMIDSTMFLAKSSNKYMLTLGTLALADDPLNPAVTPQALGSRYEYVIGDRRYRKKLAVNDFSMYASRSKTDPSKIALGDLGTSPIALKLRNLFDLGINRTVHLDDNFDFAPIGNLVETMKPYVEEGLEEELVALDKESDKDKILKLVDYRTKRRFQAVTTEASNFKLNTAQSYRSDYVSMLIGGWEARANNVKMSEAAARIGTGRAVEAKFIKGLSTDIGGGKKDARFGMLEVGEKALAAVRRGMARSLQSGAYRRHLKAKVDGFRRECELNGYDFIFYAKTGTPSREFGRTIFNSGMLMFFAGIKGSDGTFITAISGYTDIRERGNSSVAAAATGNAVLPAVIKKLRHDAKQAVGSWR